MIICSLMLNTDRTFTLTSNVFRVCFSALFSRWEVYQHTLMNAQGLHQTNLCKNTKYLNNLSNGYYFDASKYISCWIIWFVFFRYFCFTCNLHISMPRRQRNTEHLNTRVLFLFCHYPIILKTRKMIYIIYYLNDT